MLNEKQYLTWIMFNSYEKFLSCLSIQGNLHHAAKFCSYYKHCSSVLWRCWLGGKKGIWPVKNWVVATGVVICLEQGADLHMAQLMPLPLTVSCSSKIQIGFTFLVPADLGTPGKKDR